MRGSRQSWVAGRRDLRDERVDEGFAYTWLVVNPANGRTISDEQAIDMLINLLHHGLVGGD